MNRWFWHFFALLGVKEFFSSKTPLYQRLVLTGRFLWRNPWKGLTHFLIFFPENFPCCGCNSRGFLIYPFSLLGKSSTPLWYWLGKFCQVPMEFSDVKDKVLHEEEVVVNSTCCFRLLSMGIFIIVFSRSLLGHCLSFLVPVRNVEVSCSD